MSELSRLLQWYLPYVLVSSLVYGFTQDGLGYASPFTLMAARYLIVASIFFILVRRIDISRESLIVAFLFSVSTLFWALGLEYVSTGDSAVLTFTMPLFSIPLAALIIGERIAFQNVAGALIGFSGVMLYSSTLSHGSLLLGAIYTLINAVLWAAGSVYYRKLRNRDPLPLLTAQFLLGSIPFLIGSAFFPKIQLTDGLLVDMAYLVVFGGVLQTFFWNSMLRVQSVARITTFAFAVPAVTVFLQSVETSALPPWTSVLGATVMFLGIFVSSRGRMEQAPIVSEKATWTNPSGPSFD